MAERPQILVLRGSNDDFSTLGVQVDDSTEMVEVRSPVRALSLLNRERYDAIFITPDFFAEAVQVGKFVQNERILEGMPDGVVLVDREASIVWGNGRLSEWSHRESVLGENFYEVLGSPEILGPDFSPLNTAFSTQTSATSTLRSADNQYFELHAAPVMQTGYPPDHLVVTVRDVTAQTLQQQKMAAIHQAGIELADLTADEVASMTVEERIELLKSNILHFTKDLLNFDVVEIRLLDQETGYLEPLLQVGIEEEAARRKLRAEAENNGVTGFVAATGKSYLCEQTGEDPLYLEGAKGARSSLTVPLVYHDQVIGTFNVESPEKKAFGESDLQFLEIFSRDVAVSINTLELLAAQKASSAVESVEAIHRAVARPVDDILNDAVNVMERYIGHEPDVVERLQSILRNARDIKQMIHKVGQKMAPIEAQPQSMRAGARPKLVGKRMLVVDADDSVRSAAHALLERYGCFVETAHDGAEATFMVRNLEPGVHYDVIIADIRLPDVNGYELMVKLRELLDYVPLVLMTGFGYDPGHSIVKARREGLLAVLYKPFRLDQLLQTVEMIVSNDDSSKGNQGVTAQVVGGPGKES